jgi:hypothetical protein
MSATDLAMLIDRARSSIGPAHLSVDPGLVLVALGLTILGVFFLYATVKITLWLVRTIADMEPSQFAKATLITGFILLVVGLLLP